MKINSIQPTIPMKGSFTKNIKQKCQMFGLAFSALGYAAKDIFVPRKKVYIEIDGKRLMNVICQIVYLALVIGLA